MPLLLAVTPSRPTWLTLPKSSPTTPANPHSSLGFNLAGIAVLVLLLAVGVAYLVDELGRNSGAPTPNLEDGELITQTIAGRELHIPTKWFRYGEQIRDGFTNQIDLSMLPEPQDTPVQVTLLPRSRARASSALLDAVYVHQFGDGTLSGVPGLVGKPLTGKDNASLQGESVWYDALSATPFVAKCAAAVQTDASAQPAQPDAPARCLRTVYLASGIAAIYAFDASHLQNWRSFDADLSAWLKKIGAL